MTAIRHILIYFLKKKISHCNLNVVLLAQNLHSFRLIHRVGKVYREGRLKISMLEEGSQISCHFLDWGVISVIVRYSEISKRTGASFVYL
jgi:hypothetical protein